MKKIIQKITNKIRKQNGESLAEVLVALLVSLLGLVLLASMITSSVNIVTKSRDGMEKYVEKENTLVEQGSSEEKPGTLSINAEGGAPYALTGSVRGDVAVVYYSNSPGEEQGSRTVYTYHIPEE